MYLQILSISLNRVSTTLSTSRLTITSSSKKLWISETMILTQIAHLTNTICVNITVSGLFATRKWQNNLSSNSFICVASLPVDDKRMTPPHLYSFEVLWVVPIVIGVSFLKNAKLQMYSFWCLAFFRNETPAESGIQTNIRQDHFIERITISAEEAAKHSRQFVVLDHQIGP